MLKSFQLEIYTSYYAGFFNCDHDFKDAVPISIAQFAPRYYGNIIEYKDLAPSADILREYKEKGNIEVYLRRYYSEILNSLDRRKVINDLLNISEGKRIVLLCYEKPEDFCHRHESLSWIYEGTNLPRCGEIQIRRKKNG